MKLGFLFPGQGSQYVGMGKDLYEEYSQVKLLYDQAEHILQFPLTTISFEGPTEELKQTRYTQPAIFVHSLAVIELFKEREIKPDAVAGHSLGEYSALVTAEALSFEDGLNLVKLRGELMQFAGEKNPGTMAAIIGLSEEIVIDICKEASETGFVHPANYNSPGQVVISGSIGGVHKAMELAKEKNARMASELTVSGAFHSPLMEDALEGLSKTLDETEIRKAVCPVYTNVSAQAVTNPDEIREALKKQLLSPVLWQNGIENMISDGCQKFYEIGPSKVLSGLNKRIDRDIQCFPIGKLDDIISLNEEV